MIEIHRRMGRLAAAVTAGSAVIAVTGVAVAGAASSAGTDTVRRASTSLEYTCRFPSGARQVAVRVAAVFPVAGTVGEAIQPTGVQVTATVPRAVVGDLGRLGATTVHAKASIGVTVAEGRTSASAAWQSLTARPARLPAVGSMMLPVTGTVPPVNAGTPGEVTFMADGLLLALTPRKADGTATTPAVVTVVCSPGPGQDRELAAVPISGSGPSPSASGLPSPGRRLRVVAGRPRHAPDSLSAGSCFIKSANPWIGSSYIAGFSDVKKLKEAALVGPGPDNRPRAGLSDLNLLYNIFDSCTQTFYSYNTGELNYRGRAQLPPARSTFLNFGFVPVTATIEITLVPLDCRDITGHLVGKVGLCIVLKQPVSSTQSITTVTSEQQIRAYDVTVNGVPLNVGQHCQTAVPAKVVLTGNPGYDVTKGGALSGNVTIPPFTGCGVGENLDPLLTASISGPGNFVQLTQGPSCLKFLPSGQVNTNCRIPPGPGHKFGVPKFFPKPQR